MREALARRWLIGCPYEQLVTEWAIGGGNKLTITDDQCVVAVGQRFRQWLSRGVAALFRAGSRMTLKGDLPIDHLSKRFEESIQVWSLWLYVQQGLPDGFDG